MPVGDRIGVYRNKGEGMACQRVCFALLMGALTAVAVSPARAQQCGPNCAPACAPCTRTITCTKCVPECYTVKRCGYKVVCEKVPCTTYRCEYVCEPRERCVTVCKRIPCEKTIMKKVCRTINVCEERTTMQTCYQYQQVTKMVKKCTQCGHWECRQECCQPGCLAKLCNPCACPTTVTRKCWVCCPQYTECPVTCCQRVCVQKPVTCKVNVCKTVWDEVPCKVCTYTCVQEQVKQCYTVRTCRKVPCESFTIVRKCVPYEYDVTCTRYVRQCYQVEVPCCNNCCGGGCCRLFSLFSCCNHGCNNCCDNNCAGGACH